ncbi:MAG: threonylcarbamoyl-AMP synthase [Dehalococcoidaceae bacterium]|nr:threonylcarbamoyl-AMP synthase [Dehalococcoidaceae bacterium]
MSLNQQVEIGAGILKSGGVVAYPTDTVYGLGACYDCIPAIERVYTIKERDPSCALPLIVANISQLETVVSEITLVARKLIDAFWPGALTIVLPRSYKVPDLITGGKSTVAVRLPACPAAVLLAERTGKPICATSANISGQASAMSGGEVRRKLGDRLDFIIDGGRVERRVESTIIDLTWSVPRILRPGPVGRDSINQICSVE